MLLAQNVSHQYRGAAALAPIDLQLGATDHCALMGPSGSGKSTLLHVLAGILPPATGVVSLAGESLYASPPRTDLWRARRIGVVPQRLHLLASLSARDNIVLAQYFGGERRPQRVEALLAALNLQSRADAMPAQLSVGEQQRVAIARAICGQPQLLLADEPTSSLDDEHAERALDQLFEAARLSQALLVIATHDARVCSRFQRIVQLQRP